MTETVQAAQRPNLMPFWARYQTHLAAVRQQGGAIVFYPHERADGDALGAAFGWAHHLNQQGFETWIDLEEPVPEKFLYLLEETGVSVRVRETELDEAAIAAVLAAQGLAIAVDSHGADRLGRREPCFERAARRMILDHHPSNRPLDADYHRDTQAAATCQLVAELLLLGEQTAAGAGPADVAVADAVQRPMDAVSATACLTGVLTDTGRFSFTNTRAEVLMVAAELVRRGADLPRLVERLFSEMRAARFALMGLVSTRTSYHADGHLAVSWLTESDLTAVDAMDTDVDGLVNLMRDVAGVDCALLLRDTETGTVRGSLRSSDRVDVSVFARAMGGGGHAAASAFRIAGEPLAAVRERCIDALCQAYWPS